MNNLIQYDREIDEASRDGDEGQVRNPELVRAGWDQSPGEVGEVRTTVIAVGRGHEPAARAYAEALLAHDPHGPLVVDDTIPKKLSGDPP
jgi:hypothetical protein